MDTVSRRTRRRWARCLGTGATVVIAATAVASGAGAAQPATRPSAVIGKVAAIAGSSMEVQNPESGQTTVAWTTTTQFSKIVAEKVGQVTAGDCVSATGTLSKSSKTTLAARTITITTPSSSGTCLGAQGSPATGGPFPEGNGSSGLGPGPAFRFRGPGSSGGNETPPSFPRGSVPRPGGAFADLAFASGKVTAVNGSTVSVTGVLVSPGSFTRPGTSHSSRSTNKNASSAKTGSSRTTKSASNSNSSNNKSRTAAPARPALTTQSLKLTTTNSTTVTATQAAAATDLAVGDCVSALGPAATNGSVTATIVRITSTNGGTCTAGFGRFGGGGFFGRSGGAQSGGGVV